MPRIKKEEVVQMAEKNKEMSSPRVPKNDAITVKRLHRRKPVSEPVPISRALPTIPLVDPVKTTPRIKLEDVKKEKEPEPVIEEFELPEPRELTTQEEEKILEYIDEVKEKTQKEMYYHVEEPNEEPSEEPIYTVTTADGMGMVEEPTTKKIEKIAMYFGAFCCGLITLGIAGIILALIAKLIMFIL